MKYLIIGASSGLGRELSYVFAKNKNDLLITSRDARDLQAIKSDLENKFKINVDIIQIDLSSEQDLEKNLFKEKYFKEINGILFPIGLMFDNDNLDLDVEKSKKIFKSNYNSIAIIISKFANSLSLKEGCVVGFGSISGYLGRKINPYYAASKRALESFFESLSFTYNNKNLKIQFYVLGYLETNLSFGKNLKLPKGSPTKLSKVVYKNKNKKFLKTFFPYWWFFIASALKLIPLKILIKFKKLFK